MTIFLNNVLFLMEVLYQLLYPKLTSPCRMYFLMNPTFKKSSNILDVSAIDSSAMARQFDDGSSATSCFGDNDFWVMGVSATPIRRWTFRRRIFRHGQFGDERFGDVCSVMDSLAMDVSATYKFGDGRFGDV